MTARAIVTGCSYDEPWKSVADKTWGSMARYAEAIGVAFHWYALQPHPSRHWSWQKLGCLASGLSTYDEVLWLDADVAVVDRSENIFDAVPESSDMAMARLTDGLGRQHFNCGVWLARRTSLPILMAAAMDDACIHHCWWEQAAINKLANESNTHALHERWNHWRGSPQDLKPMFRHACDLPGSERIRLITEWVEECR
jgi:hypothetical protein